jgi:D-threo-aldose 1-dehydrogenase
MYSLRAIRESADDTFDGVMAAGSWNLIDQDGCELYKECEKRGMYIHNAGIYASGLLVGGSTYKYGPASEEVMAKKKAWERLCEEFGNVSLPAVAMAFSVAPNVVKKFAVGVKSRFEVEKTLEWLNEIDNIDPKIWEEAKRRGLLSSDCTVPNVF